MYVCTGMCDIYVQRVHACNCESIEEALLGVPSTTTTEDACGETLYLQEIRFVKLVAQSLFALRWTSVVAQTSYQDNLRHKSQDPDI